MANYIQYQENNGTLTEKLYEEVDSITSANFDDITAPTKHPNV